MKKIICILLALSLLLLATGCTKPVESEKPEEEKRPQIVAPEDDVKVEINASNLSGTWSAELDLSEFLTNALFEYELMQMGMMVTDFYINVSMEFRENGTYRVWVDMDSVNASTEMLMDLVTETVWQEVEMMYMDLENELTLEEILKKENVDPDKDVEELRQHLTTEGYLGKLQERIDREGKFEIIQDELYLSKDVNEDVLKQFCDIIELGANTLTFVDCFADIDFEGYLLYPLTFNRMK